MPEIEPDRIMRRARRAPLFAPSEFGERVSYTRSEIEKLIPHRGSFLLLDAITGMDRTRSMGTRYLDPKDAVFADHFPSDPVYPGVLLVEMMGQLALASHAACNGGGEQAPARVRFIRLHDAAFVDSALPGDNLGILSQGLDDSGYTFLACGQVLRGTQVLAAAVFEAVVMGEDDVQDTVR